MKNILFRYTILNKMNMAEYARKISDICLWVGSKYQSLGKAHYRQNGLDTLGTDITIPTVTYYWELLLVKIKLAVT
jgi:hypothetical protein